MEGRHCDGGSGNGWTQDRARGRRRNVCEKRIGLVDLEGGQHGRGMGLVADGW